MNPTPSLLEAKLRQERNCFILAKAKLKERQNRLQSTKEVESKKSRPVLVPVHNIPSSLEEDSEEDLQNQSADRRADTQLLKQHATIKKIQKELESEREVVQELRLRERELIQEVESKKVLSARYLRQVHQHKDAAGQAANAIDQLRKELQETKINLEESNLSFSKLEAESNAAILNHDQLTRELDTIQDKYAIAKDTIKELEQELGKARQETAKLSQQRESNSESEKVYQREVVNLKDRVSELNSLVKKYELEQVTLNGRLGEALREKDESSLREKSLQEKLLVTTNSLLREREEHERRIHEYNLKMRKMESDSAIQMQRIRSAQTQAAESLEAFQTLATQLVSERSKSSETIAEKNRRTVDALKRLQTIESRMKANVDALTRQGSAHEHGSVSSGEPMMSEHKSEASAAYTGHASAEYKGGIITEHKHEASMEGENKSANLSDEYDEIVVDIDLPNGSTSQLVLNRFKDPRKAVDEFASANQLVDRAAQELYSYVREQLDEHWS